MNFRALAYPIVISALLAPTSPNTVLAQEAGQPKVLLSSIAHGQKSVVLRFIISNESKSTIYVRNFRSNKAEDFILDSGDTLQYPQISGVSECQHDLNNCLGQSGTDINEYSEIEPGKSVPLSLTFFTQKSINENDNVSGSVVLIARFSNSAGDPGRPTSKRFPFLNKPINWK